MITSNFTFVLGPQMKFFESENFDELEYRERFSLLRTIAASLFFYLAASLDWRILLIASQSTDFATRLVIIVLSNSILLPLGIAVGFHYRRFIINRASKTIQCWTFGRFLTRMRMYELADTSECITTSEENTSDGTTSYWHYVRLLLPKDDAILFSTGNLNHATHLAKMVNNFLGVMPKQRQNLIPDPETDLIQWIQDETTK